MSAAYDDWRFEVSSADPDAVTPVWVNLKQWVRTTGTGIRPVTIHRGRASERDDITPSNMTVKLDNSDHRFTPGNPSSPYAAWWGQARKCRLVETVSGIDYSRFTGYLKPLDMVDWADLGVEQFVTVSAVDWLGRLDRAPVFAGTLAEHVRTAGGTLVEHFPLDDRYPHLSSVTLQTLTRVVTGFDVSVATEPEDLIRAADLDGPPGDDQRYARWVPVSDGTGFLARARLESPVTVVVGATDVLALSVWVRSEPDANGYAYSGGWINLLNDDGVGISIVDSASTGLTAIWNSLSGDTEASAGRRLERDAWRLVTARINAGSGAMDLWVGADPAVTATIASAPGATTLTRTQMGQLLAGGLGHVQVRVGPDATTMTRAMHLAQYAHGYQGLHRQTVAERITTLAGYAGVPATDLNLDTAAATPMQVARLSGQRPATAMRAAADTDSGRLIVSRDGQITLQARARRYRQAVTVQIPWRWLRRGLRIREDTPINEVVASQTGGGSTRRRDTVSQARYGVGSQSVNLDTAIDADLGNYASWTVQALATPRPRCPQLVIDLLPLSDVQRAQVLAIEVGDRIELTRTPITMVTDTFGRTVAPGWGSTDTGQLWSTFGAGGTITGADASVSGGQGLFFAPVANAYRAAWLPSLSLTDVEMVATVDTFISNVAGAPIEPANLLLRMQNNSTYYMARVSIDASEAVTLALYGPSGLLASTALPLVWSGQPIRLRASISGSALSARVWDPTAGEPIGWQVQAVTTEITAPGGVGVRSGVALSNSNTKPVEFRWTDLQVTVPASTTVPPSVQHLIVEGFAPDEIGVETRTITLNTSPLLGPAAGVPPAGVMVGDLVSDTPIAY